MFRMGSLVVISSENLSPGVRGSLSKWLLEIGPGVFVGRVSRRIVDGLWGSVEEWCLQEASNNARATMVVADRRAEQGFTFRTVGEGRYAPVNFSGLWLVERTAVT